MVQLDLDTALKRQELALDSLEECYPNFLDRARAVARKIALRKGWVTADDIRECLPIPPDISPNVMGAVFKGFEFVCWVKSAQPQRHGNRIGVWRLVAKEEEHETTTRHPGRHVGGRIHGNAG